MYRRTNLLALHFLSIFLLSLCANLIAKPRDSDLPSRLIVGYWHNWVNSPNTLLLTEIPPAYDVINIAFAVPTTAYGSTMQFTPDPSIYPNQQGFINDMNFLKSEGKKVLISIGGANGPVNLNDSTEVQNFVSSMINIITTYGFDGMDIDLEGTSLFLEPGDDDFRNPTSPLITNFIDAVVALTNQLPPDFILTAAPETAFMQGGYNTYGGIWGAYLPVIHALRNQLTYIHVQHYNTGSMFGRDGNIYQPATADFHAVMADMLLAGFPVDVHGANIYFDPLLPDQVLIGLPASANAAGGYTPPSVVHTALDYVILGIPYGGQYQLSDPDGYFDFRGLMTWSINWDVHNNNQFSNSHRGYLDSLATTNIGDGSDDIETMPQIFVLEQNYPNPFNAITTIAYQLNKPARVTLKVFNLLGQEVATLVEERKPAGKYTVSFDASGIESGIYFYSFWAGNFGEVKQMTLAK